jgi:hypothetical protein
MLTRMSVRELVQENSHVLYLICFPVVPRLHERRHLILLLDSLHLASYAYPNIGILFGARQLALLG